MVYALLIKKEAQKTLELLSKKERLRITEKEVKIVAIEKIKPRGDAYK